jgi:hypothetical protein
VLKLSRDEVIAILAPFAERLFRIGAVPFERWLEEYPNQESHPPRTRANIVYDLMTVQARLEFRGARGTEIIDAPSGVTLLSIADAVCIRFKKLDEESLPSNNRTQATKDWESGDDLPGIPSALQRLALGYRLNRLQTAVKDVLISNSRAGVLLYDIILDEPDAGLIVLTPKRNDSGSSSGGQTQKPRRVRIRKSDEQTEI